MRKLFSGLHIKVANTDSALFFLRPPTYPPFSLAWLQSRPRILFQLALTVFKKMLLHVLIGHAPNIYLQCVYRLSYLLRVLKKTTSFNAYCLCFNPYLPNRKALPFSFRASSLSSHSFGFGLHQRCQFHQFPFVCHEYSSRPNETLH